MCSVVPGEQDLTNEFIIGGIIVKFSLQFELGRKVLKELLRYEGVAVAATGSPREILKAAYKIYPCMDENIWLGMLAQRNNMAHMYDGAAAAELAGRVINDFIPAFQELEKSIEEKYHGVLEGLA